MTVEVMAADCRAAMADMAADSVDAIVTDPPYGLSFMGKDWDRAVPGPDYWAAALRVAKPGAHLLAFGGTRLWHRLACAIEDAGWEVRDSVMWLHGQGFPKSLDVSKAIDREAGAERPVIGKIAAPNRNNAHVTMGDGWQATPDLTAPATPDAARWSGWGTALKPAWEPVIVARKPLVGTVAANVLAHGTGGINVDGCRIGTAGADDYGRSCANARGTVNAHAGIAHAGKSFAIGERDGEYASPLGRWPANLVLDEEAAAALDEQSGTLKSGDLAGNVTRQGFRVAEGSGNERRLMHRPGDSGGASRFFYCAKASKAERNLGGVDNRHPTVKPLALMRWLVRLVTPPGGLVLDPFAGSGTTGIAAVMEGFRFVGCELDETHAEVARKRIASVAPLVTRVA